MAHFGNAIFQWNDHNLLAYSEDFSQWTQTGTPVLSSGQTDPFGGTAAWLVAKDSTDAFERIYSQIEPASITSSSNKVVMLWLKEGSAGSTDTRIALADLIAVANVLLATISAWGSTGPTITMTNGTALWQREFTGGWWHLGFQTDAVDPASSHEVRVIPKQASTETGDVYAFGVQVCDVNTAGSYVATNGTAIAYSTTSPAQSHSLQAPLRALRPAVRTQGFVRESLDLAHRQVTTVADPRHETLGMIRYESDQESFHAFLSAAARFPVSYIPSSCNLNDAHECWAIVNDPLDSVMDADRGFPGFEDVSLEIRLRRLDGQATTGIYG